MSHSRSSFHCLIGNNPIALETFDPHLTLLDFLRLEKNLTGTKEGCAEGDCGACTVLGGRLREGEIEYQAVNACIAPLASADGTQILTVEHISAPKPHPVQQKIAEHHGSQCGFCTPGIVMSLVGLHEACADGRAVADPTSINDALAGNLCRCTGYTPIIAAAMAACKTPRPPQSESLRQSAESILPTWEQEHTHLELQTQNGSYFAPKNLRRLWEIKHNFPNAQLVAGATDVGLWVNKAHQTFAQTVDINHIEELRKIERRPSCLTIGASVTLAEGLKPMAEISSDLDVLLRRFGSAQVRSKATFGGNIANGSPIGDLAPALIALNATLRLANPLGKRDLDLENFFIDYGKQDLGPDEVVESISIPLPSAEHFYCWKISKRFDQDISALSGAFAFNISDGIISSARIVFGGMASTPRRAIECEKALVDQPVSPDTFSTAAAALDGDFSPISDMRASATYRTLAARGLLQKCMQRLENRNPGSLYSFAAEVNDLA